MSSQVVMEYSTEYWKVEKAKKQAKLQELKRQRAERVKNHLLKEVCIFIFLISSCFNS
jgi:hypothetical protein